MPSTFRKILLIIGCALVTACGGSDLGAGFKDLPVKTAPQVATGSGGVSSAHPLASEAGAELLRSGGNAADAAVATGFALAVVENSMSGLGGRSQILVRSATGELHGIDGQTVIGSTYEPPLLIPSFTGIGVIGVPGVVGGLTALHEKFGSKPLEEVMAPAIRYARQGYAILPGEVSRHLRVEKAIRADATLSAIYLNAEQKIHSPGEVFRQADLAETLDKIAAGGADVFYRSDLTRKMSDDLEARGGGVTYEDFAAYQARDSKVVTTGYRGYEIAGTTAPANGTAVVAALQILDHINMSALSEVEWGLAISQVMALTMQRTVFDDPNDEAVDDTLGDAQLKKFLAAMSFTEDVAMNHRQTREVVSWQDQNAEMLVGQVDWSGSERGEFAHHTTHHVSADESGMVVSITQTLGPNMGSRVMTPGMGFIYAQTGGMPDWVAELEPGDRPRTSIAPTIILKDGEPVMSLGAAGGLLIPTAVVQVISRVIDRGMTLEEALAAPRIAPEMKLLPSPEFVSEEVALEMTPVNGWSEAEAQAFESAGIKVNRQTKYSVLARVHAAIRDKESGHWTVVADPDWEGSAAVVDANEASSDPM